MVMVIVPAVLKLGCRFLCFEGPGIKPLRVQGGKDRECGQGSLCSWPV